MPIESEMATRGFSKIENSQTFVSIFTKKVNNRCFNNSPLVGVGLGRMVNGGLCWEALGYESWIVGRAV